MDYPGAAFLKYRDMEANGRANIHLRQGGIRFWFKPNWSSGTGPGHWADLFCVGQVDDTTGGWFALRISANGSTLQFTAADGNSGSQPTLRLEKSISLTQGTWYQIVLGYGEHPARTHHVVRLYLNGDETLSASLDDPIPHPPAATRQAGFTIGSNLAGGEQAEGCIEEFETFNHLLGRVNVLGRVAPYWLGTMLTAQPLDNPASIQLEWCTDPNKTVKVERKPASGSQWTTLTTGLPGWSYRDQSVTAGQEYDYRVTVENSSPLVQLELRAVYQPIVPEDRGKVILLIEGGLAANLSAEIQRLQQDLADDGWTVITHNTARHDDDEWSNNPGEIASIKTFSRNTYDADPENTKDVFILGHVPIPYSGIAVDPDDHSEHAGAWPADGYYGNLATTGWTDTSSWQPWWWEQFPRQVNLPGDGKFDQDAFPLDAQGRRLALFVGRVDFANLPAFEETSPVRTEVDLLRGYLDKNHRYRAGLLRFAPRTVVANWYPHSQPHRPTVSRGSTRRSSEGRGQSGSSRMTSSHSGFLLSSMFIRPGESSIA